MSEDTGSGGAGWSGVSVPTMLLVADRAETAQLVAAAGWTGVQTGIEFAPKADILALDWRQQVPEQLPDFAADCALLVLVSLETIDQADAVLGGYHAHFVFGSGAALIAAELSELVLLAGTRHASDPSGGERARLQALARELARIAEQLSAFPEEGEASAGVEDRSHGYHAETASDRLIVKPPSADRIRQLIAMRRLRDRFFSPDLFADPAWDILLDLAASRIERKSVSVSSLCIAAAVPPTTALRWIRMMTEQGLLVRRADPADARRMFVDLSDSAFGQLCRWFALVESRGGPGV